MPTMIRSGLHHTFAAFAVAPFRLHWALTVAAFMSFSMSFTVLGIVAFDLEGDNTAVSIAMAGNGVAWFIIGPYAGALADRLQKRALLVFAQTVIALTFAALAILILTDRIAVLWLTLSSFMMGACFAFTGPTRRAYIADLVPQRLIGNGVALLQTGLTFPAAVGPVIASLLLAIPFVGAAGAYLFMASTLALTVAALFLMPPGQPRRLRRRSVLREIALGLRYAWRHKRVRVLLLALVLVSAAAGPYQFLLPGLLEHQLHIDADQLGLVTWPMGVGSFIVGLAVAGVVATRWSGPVMFAMGIAFGLGVALLGLVPDRWWMLPVVFLIGAGFSAFQTLNTAEIIHQSQPQFHGRITSLTFVPFGVQSMAGLAMGVLADTHGERPVLLTMGLTAIAFALLFAAIYRRTADPPAPALPRATTRAVLPRHTLALAQPRPQKTR